MPGEKIEDALGAAATLQAAADHHDPHPARRGRDQARRGRSASPQHYLDVLDKVKAAGLDAQISVKPTQLGLDLDAGQCQRNLDRICEKAERLGNVPVWIDMENSPYVDPTLKLFRHEPGERYRASASRSRPTSIARPRTSRRSIPLGPAVRIVKGAYLEPPDVAYPEEVGRRRELLHAVRAADAQTTRRRRGSAAAHRHARRRARRSAHSPTSTSKHVPPPPTSSRCSTASSAAQQQRLAQSGRRIRVLISYGEYWFPWYMRRLAERPANVGFVLKNMIGG